MSCCRNNNNWIGNDRDRHDCNRNDRVAGERDYGRNNSRRGFPCCLFPILGCNNRRNEGCGCGRH